MPEWLISGIFPLLLTLAAYSLGLILQKKLKHALFNPILTAALLIVLLIRLSDYPLNGYIEGNKAITWLLTPATVALAIPLHEQIAALRKHLAAILVGIAAGTVCSLVIIAVLCLLLRLDTALTASILPKSVTTAIGVPLAELQGGIGSVTTAVIILTGILGSVTGPMLCRLLRLHTVLAQGVAFGTASHVVGTAKANELDPLMGAVSSLSLVVAGLLTALLLPPIVRVIASVQLGV